MKILTGRWPGNREEAILLAVSETGKNDVSLDIVKLFAPVIEIHKLHEETEKSINAAVHNRYGRYDFE